MAERIIEIQGLEVRYGAVPAGRGVDIDVDAGEIVGLVGPNGAGKSTTLFAVMGAALVRSGDIRVQGESVLGRRTEDIARRGVALVPEGRHIFANLTVAENLELGLIARPPEVDGSGDVDATLEWIHELFPIVGQFRDRQAGALSGGQQQQLAIARGLLADPRVLLLDEPSLGLAPSVVVTVWEALRHIRERGVTILLVEQRAQITIELASRTYVMNNGEIRATLRPEDATDTERIASAYFGADR
jgi:branched-chain amino acid transport system ATP-binding protein